MSRWEYKPEIATTYNVKTGEPILATSHWLYDGAGKARILIARRYDASDDSEIPDLAARIVACLSEPVSAGGAE